MALPFSRDRTYVAGSTPTIKAADLNDLQDYIVNAYQALKTLKALQVDGASDNATAVLDGCVRVSRALSGTNAGLPLTTVQPGEFGRGLVCMGWASVAAGGTLDRGINIRSCTRVGAGQYTVTLNTGPTTDFVFTGTQLYVHPVAGPTPRYGYRTSANDGGGRLQIAVNTFSDAALTTPADASFVLTVFAE